MTTRSHAPLWTLDELTAEAASALGMDYAGQASGRIRDMPDKRTIRYYTTRGLIDRPAQMRGRTALYGWRHLLQLVAIKRLQANGLTLAEIQTRLTGQTDAVLSKLAQMEEKSDLDHPRRERRAEDRRDEHFWREPPAPVPQDESKKDDRDALPLLGVILDEGVTLLLESTRPLDDMDLEALRLSAAPLLKTVKTRRIRDAQRTRQSKGDAP